MLTLFSTYRERKNKGKANSHIRYRAIAAALLFICISTDLFAEFDFGSSIQANKFNTTGYVKNETAYRIHEPRTYTKIRNTLYGQLSYKPVSSSEFIFAGRTYYDAVYELFEYDTISGRSRRDIDQPLSFVENMPQEIDSSIVEAREFHFNYYGNDFDLRIGRQFIIWGVLTGVRVVDEINPMDFRELITPDLLDYRIPLLSTKLDWYTSHGDVQVIWIPELTFHKAAPRGSEWELFQEVPGTQRPNTLDIRNWEAGIRFTRPVAEGDLSLSYFYTWDDFPVIFRDTWVIEFGSSPDPEFGPSYQRMHMFGTTYERAVDKYILKFEAAFVLGKYFGLSNVDSDQDGYLDHRGVLKREHLRYGLGIDFNVWKTETSLSMTQWFVPRYHEDMVMDQLDTSFNIYLRRNIPERQAIFEFLGIILPNLEEAYLKPKLSFRPSDKLLISAGMDIFFGEKSRLGVVAIDGNPTNLMVVTQSAQFIGNFNKNDRVFVEFKYSF